jgi:hypothetical protein
MAEIDCMLLQIQALMSAQYSWELVEPLASTWLAIPTEVLTDVTGKITGTASTGNGHFPRLEMRSQLNRVYVNVGRAVISEPDTARFADHQALHDLQIAIVLRPAEPRRVVAKG